MARGGGGREQREGNALKTALVVTGGLVLVWVTVETAFGSFLSRLRGAVDRSNPRTDPDDDEVNAPAPPPPVPPPVEEGKDEPESVVVDENEAEKPPPYSGGHYQESVPGQVESEATSEESYYYE